MTAETDQSLDVLIVGAGISGIDAAFHLQKSGRRFRILEARGAIGGTWDLFRYPGIRSDSDMFTLGFPFRPWRGEKAIADGEAIREYVEETAREFGIDRQILFHHRAVRARWSTSKARWTVEVETPQGETRFHCRFLFLCSGYYDYDQGYRPNWPGEEAFEGLLVHPQFWPADLETKGRRIIVIGSGATAVTLAPALAREAAKLVLLQRSPSYIVARPSLDRLAAWLQRRLPERLAAWAIRWKNVLLGMLFFQQARKRPERVKKAIAKLAARQLPAGFDMDRHLAPDYDPWDQRVCLAPDGDLFECIAAGRVEMVTDRIERFLPDGLLLESGRRLEADIIVAATGLVLKLLGGIALEVDGERVKVEQRFAYKGMMLSGVPNLALAFGYTNASWTLKCDLSSLYVCRLLDHMERGGFDYCVPRLPEEGLERRAMLDFTSGYVLRARSILPAQGPEAPWRVHQNYLRDLVSLRFGKVADGTMHFGRASAGEAEGRGS